MLTCNTYFAIAKFNFEIKDGRHISGTDVAGLQRLAAIQVRPGTIRAPVRVVYHNSVNFPSFPHPQQASETRLSRKQSAPVW